MIVIDPSVMLNFIVLFESIDIPSSLLNDDNLLSVSSVIEQRKQYLILTFKDKTPVIEEFSNNKNFHNMIQDEEQITCFDKSKVVNDNVDVNGVIPTKHYYGPIVKVRFKWPQ